MISIAVLEDEDEFAKTLMGHIHQYSIEMNIPIEVERFYDGMSFLDEYSEKYQLNKIAARWPAKAMAQFFFTL